MVTDGTAIPTVDLGRAARLAPRLGGGGDGGGPPRAARRPAPPTAGRASTCSSAVCSTTSRENGFQDIKENLIPQAAPRRRARGGPRERRLLPARLQRPDLPRGEPVDAPAAVPRRRSAGGVLVHPSATRGAGGAPGGARAARRRGARPGRGHHRRAHQHRRRVHRRTRRAGRALGGVEPLRGRASGSVVHGCVVGNDAVVRSGRRACSTWCARSADAARARAAASPWRCRPVRRSGGRARRASLRRSCTIG